MEIIVTWFLPSGKFRRSEKIDIGALSLVDLKQFKQEIVNRESVMSIGWQGYYYITTDIANQKMDWYRGFHCKLFKPEEFEGIGKYGKKPWKYSKNAQKELCIKMMQMAREEGKMEMKMGEPRPDNKGNIIELKKKGYRGLYGRYP